MLVFESTVSLEASELIAANAGDGGSGAAGETGQQDAGGGGTGGGIGATQGCSGGAGGFGGNGASGGGGAGGISVGIVWSGAIEPVMDEDTTSELGTRGDGGIGGTPATNNGIDGQVADVLEVE
ncbi:MAG TPA: hypothetical protein VF989_00630 [Polyangiaceae bacterium]